MDQFLNSVLRGLVTYSVGIFIVLILGELIYIRLFLIALKEWQKSVFGLERSLAQRKLVTSTTGMTSDLPAHYRGIPDCDYCRTSDAGASN